MRNRCLFLSMVLLGVCLFMPQKSLAQSTIACNSDEGRRHSCPVDTRGGVHLVTQHSESECTEGTSWGFDKEGIWVDHGCRADFSVGGNRESRDEKREEERKERNGGNEPSQTIACNSDEGRRQSCSVDTRDGVRLLRKHSDAACTEGYSWGADREGIWVDHGCRAEFSVGGDRNLREESRKDQEGGNEPSQTIACNSDEGRRQWCSVDTRGGEVRLVTQHSEAACTRGYSWGANRSGIWVSHGCRADFVVIARYRRDSGQ